MFGNLVDPRWQLPAPCRSNEAGASSLVPQEAGISRIGLVVRCTGEQQRKQRQQKAGQGIRQGQNQAVAAGTSRLGWRFCVPGLR